MANQDSTQFAADAISPNDPNDFSGRLRVAFFEHTTDGTETANDTVSLINGLPDGARVLTGQIHIDGIDATSDGATTPTTVEVGDAGNQDRYLASTAADSDVNVELNDPSEAGFGHEIDGSAASDQTDVLLTYTAVDAETGKSIKGYLVYVID